MRLTLTVVAVTGWGPLNATLKANSIQALNASVQLLRELAPDTGAYVNEVCFSPIGLV